jgi:glutamine synthetase
MYRNAYELDQLIEKVRGIDMEKDADMIKTDVIEKMAESRKTCDQAEKLCAKEYWPMPDYGDLLFSID